MSEAAADMMTQSFSRLLRLLDHSANPKLLGLTTRRKYDECASIPESAKIASVSNTADLPVYHSESSAVSQATEFDALLQEKHIDTEL